MKQSTVQISRDPFARQSLVRQRAGGECAWCGGEAKFIYGTQRDDRHRPDMLQRRFCSIGCFRSYSN